MPRGQASQLSVTVPQRPRAGTWSCAMSRIVSSGTARWVRVLTPGTWNRLVESAKEKEPNRHHRCNCTFPASLQRRSVLLDSF